MVDDFLDSCFMDRATEQRNGCRFYLSMIQKLPFSHLDLCVTIFLLPVFSGASGGTLVMNIMTVIYYDLETSCCYYHLLSS